MRATSSTSCPAAGVAIAVTASAASDGFCRSGGGRDGRRDGRPEREERQGTRLTRASWQILRRPLGRQLLVGPGLRGRGHSSNDTPEKELVGYAGPNGELRLLGLDTNGRNLNGVSADPPGQYSIGC